jgi:hypothetical protein
MCQKIANTLTACPKCRIQWDNYIILQEKREEGEDLQNWLLIRLLIFIQYNDSIDCLLVYYYA